ncbi:hypothetical protein HO173_006952 [Letharia columbiana]|uniref:CAF1B/HIR1 beta-propeller domain-containing protein n=1 Tax=Letharia columbiana TaxID=112416 RepID=A0A8H6L3Z3_9LECA|nr:uncharacterized protein HO173_006952 [Letharia columbiana]KAF6234732.1 hypothetical protein HO173_006952 [Letharia columbiana]
MKASPLLISWHNDNLPIYSVHFEPHGKGRLATAGGDNNVRLWKVEKDGEERNVTYLTTLIKHTQAVNVVRFAPRGEMLASAGDDGNTLLWVPSETHSHTPAFGEDALEDKETWRIKHMCRSSGSEIYDLAWSPDGIFFITGSMDNIARIYNAQSGQMVRQIAEHNHYVQGVAWDPLNEYVATQSSDRSCHIYKLKTKDGQFTLNQYNRVTKMDLPGRRISSSSPAPPESAMRGHLVGDASSLAPGSPQPSMPGTPTSLALPMNPPVLSHSRRSSFGSSPSIRRSASPAPSMPLPAVLPMEKSPNPYLMGSMGVKNAAIYGNETCTSFFRRLTFAPDGSLLFTPAGQYKTPHPADGAKNADDVINTVYIYTRAGLNRPPIAHLPGHKKASIAVQCSPVFYTLRSSTRTTANITIDTSSAEEAIAPLPDSVLSSKPSTHSAMDPPPSTAPSPMESSRPTSSPRPTETDPASMQGPTPAFAMPYRVVYAVATQDAVLVYDTQQMTPLIMISNLHFATFTDLTWSNDGLTLLMSSSDGFCSNLTFNPGELGQIYSGHVPTAHHPSPAISTMSTAQPSPTTASAPPFDKQSTPVLAPSASPAPLPPPSPTRSNSTSSIATQSSQMVNNPTPTLGSVPSVAATNPSFNGLPWTTPPQTPMSGVTSRPSSVSGSVLGKRDTSESEKEEAAIPKKRRIAPTLVRDEDPSIGS